MTDQAWIALATLSFLVLAAFFGWLHRRFDRIDNRISSQFKVGDDRWRAFSGKLETIERRSEDRHAEYIERLTRLETVVLNGHAPKRKRASS